MFSIIIIVVTIIISIIYTSIYFCLIFYRWRNYLHLFFINLLAYFNYSKAFFQTHVTISFFFFFFFQRDINMDSLSLPLILSLFFIHYYLSFISLFYFLPEHFSEGTIVFCCFHGVPILPLGRDNNVDLIPFLLLLFDLLIIIYLKISL